MSEQTDKRTATQKIEDLEKVVTMLYTATAEIKNAVENLFKGQADMPLIKDALKLLNKKTEAIIQTATPETGITAASVSAIVIQMNVDDLKNQVAQYIANGHLAPADTVAADSFLVAEESNQDGTLANPRIQFRLDSQDPTTVAALTGKKVGEVVSFGENRFSAKILEIYSITEPKAPEAAAPAAEAAPAPAAEAPAAPEAAPAEAAAPEAPAAALAPLPAETPVTEFVPSEPSTMATA